MSVRHFYTETLYRADPGIFFLLFIEKVLEDMKKKDIRKATVVFNEVYLQVDSTATAEEICERWDMKRGS